MSKNETPMTLSEATQILNSDAWQLVIDESWSNYRHQRLSCPSYKSLLKTCFGVYISSVRGYIEQTAGGEESAITHQETLRQYLFEATLIDFNEYLDEINSSACEAALGEPLAPASDGRNFILDSVFLGCADTMMDQEVPVGLVNSGDTLGDVIEAQIIHLVMTDALKTAPPEYLLKEFEHLKQQWRHSGEAFSDL